MTISRSWATPLTIGAFVLMASTGMLMFFHLDSGINKEVHEWLGWAMVAGVASHVTVNWASFKRHLSQTTGQVIVGLFVVVLVGSFFIHEEDEGSNPARRVTQAVLTAPLHDIAPLAHRTPAELTTALQQAGFKIESSDQTLQSITGPEREAQFKALAAIFH